MKKLLAVLLGLLLPATAQALTVRYISPTADGAVTWAQATNINTPATVARFNTSVVAGDSVICLPGTYTDGLDIPASGIPASRIAVVGTAADPTAVSFASIRVHRRDYISLRWLSSRSSIAISGEVTAPTYSTSKYGVFVKLVAAGSWTMNGSGCVVDSCTFGTDQSINTTFWSQIGNIEDATPPTYYGYTTSNRISNTTATFRQNNSVPDIFPMRSQKFWSWSNCNIKITGVGAWPSGGGSHGIELIYSYGDTFRDCRFEFDLSACNSDAAISFNVRDSSGSHLFERCEFRMRGGPGTEGTFFRLSGPGNTAGPSPSLGSRFVGCTFKSDATRSKYGQMLVFTDGSRDTFEFCRFISSALPILGNSDEGGAIKYHAAVFRHCTFYSKGSDNVWSGFSPPTGPSRFAHNLIVSDIAPTGTSYLNSTFGAWQRGTWTVIDSNLVYSYGVGADSTKATADGSSPVGAPSTFRSKTFWGSPEFVDRAFDIADTLKPDLRPNTGSKALNGPWKDGYVGFSVGGVFTPPGDTDPPAQVTNLSAKALTPDTVLLIFTAPGDNGSAGVGTEAAGAAKDYLVRYRTISGLTAASRWGAINTYVHTDISAAPKLSGALDTIVVYNLAPDKVYWFAIKATDASGNISLMSNSDSAATPAMVEPTTGYPRYGLYAGAGSSPRRTFWPMLQADSLTVNTVTMNYLSRFPVVSFNPEAAATDSVEGAFRRLDGRNPPLLRLAEPVPNVAYIQKANFLGDTLGFATDGIHERDRDGSYYYGDRDSLGDGTGRYNPRYRYYLRQWMLQRNVHEWTRNTGWGGSDTTGSFPTWLSTTGSRGFLWRGSPKRKGWFIGTSTPWVAGSTEINANWAWKGNGTSYSYPDSMVSLFRHLYFDRKYLAADGDSARMYGGMMMDLADPQLGLIDDIDVPRAGFPSAGGRDSLNRQFVDAHVLFARRMRQEVGRSWYLSGNGASGAHYGPYLNGYMRENWPALQGGSWFTNFWWFLTPSASLTAAAPGEGGQVTDYHLFKYKPSLHWVFNFPAGYHSSDSIGVGVKDTAAVVEADLRYSLATAALTGAYHTFGPPAASLARDTLYSQLWFDEYAVNTVDGEAAINSAYTGWLGAPQDTFRFFIQPLTTTDMLATDGGAFESADSAKWTRTTSGNHGQVRVGTNTGYLGTKGLVAYVYNDTTVRVPADWAVGATTVKSWVVKSGQRWSVRFWARADHPRPVHVWFRRNSTGGNVQLGAEGNGISNNLTRLWLTQRWRRYSWPIDISTTDSTTQGVAVQLSLGFGDTTGTVYVDSIMVQQGKKDTYIREFANGVVFVNEDAVTDTVSLPYATRAIYARAANRPDLTNHGMVIPSNTPIYLPASSGTFLLAATDSVRPAAVTTLTATEMAGNIRLIWTSPGNDSLTGAATSYAVRFRAGTSFVEGNWASAIPIAQTKTPKAALTPDTLDVPMDDYGIDPSSAFSFALKSVDRFRQQSAISNAASLTPAEIDATPPSACAIDSMQRIGRRAVRVWFVQPGDDDGSNGPVQSYIVKYAATPIDTDAKWAAATTITHTTTPGTPGTATSVPVYIGRTGTWYIAVRAVDDSNWLSPYAANAAVTVVKRFSGLHVLLKGVTL